jgi:thiol-disulfide isomerase/thioredoxin
VLDLAGQTVNPFQAEDARALVFLFLATDCPISNRYAPEIKRLQARFAARGVAFRLVYPNPDTTAEEVKAHLKDYGYSLGALRDPQHALVKFAGATVTPEAAVFAPDGRLLYRGRIDDRFPALGTERAAPTQRDLEQALMAVLKGQPVAQRLTRAVGCYIAELR